MRNLPLQSSFSGVEIGYPMRLPIVHFDDFISYGQSKDSSLTALLTTYIAGGTNAAIANVDILDLATADGDVGGVVKMTTGATSGDDLYMQLEGASFYCVAGRQMVFQCRFRLDTITTTTQYFGMNIKNTVGATTTNPVDTMTSGFGFIIVNGAVNYIVKNATDTTGNVSAGLSIAASTGTGWHTAWIRWDGKDALQFFVNGALLVTTRTNIPTALYLSPCWGLSTASAVAKDLSVDYIYAGVEAPVNGR